jgi:hypothetical protein
MPRGLNRSGDFRKGTPINTATHNFGNPVTLPHDFGNDMTGQTTPPSPAQFGNTVSWTPSPAHFGNTITDGGS